MERSPYTESGMKDIAPYIDKLKAVGLTEDEIKRLLPEPVVEWMADHILNMRRMLGPESLFIDKLVNWHSFDELVVSVKKKRTELVTGAYTKYELVELFTKLPIHIRFMAYENGLEFARFRVWQLIICDITNEVVRDIIY